jgi:hypothetical protein
MSDAKLTELKQSAKKHLKFWGHSRVGYGVDANVLLALIKCAEIVQTDYLLLSADQQRKALRTLKDLGL